MEKNKITLITPPDFFENENFSILFINLNDQDQDKVSNWLANNNLSQHLNIYFYSNENNISWLLYAAARSKYRFIDLNSLDNNTTSIASYILGKTNTYYKSDTDDLVNTIQYINQNRIFEIEIFLQKALNDKTETTM